MNNNELTFRLFGVLKKFKKIITKNERRMENFNINDFIVCGLILKNEEDNKLTQVKDFSSYMNISRPAVNTILNRLEDRGIIERIRLKEDRRSVYVKLTKTAHEFIEQEKERISSFMAGIINKLGRENTINLIELLEKTNQIMEKEVG